MTDQEIARALEKMIQADADRPALEQIQDLMEAGVIDEQGRVLIGFNYSNHTVKNSAKDRHKSDA